VRKIIHVDMDAFYASVEQRDDPQLRGKPVIVAWKGNRSVVCAASYEARAFGVRSAMPAVRAERLCPAAIFVAPDFTRYRAVSKSVREIFQRHTDRIEPLSLDEAYLDVTQNKTCLPTATQVARTIREQIRQELSLTASAGVAPNKFLAKLASDWRKPDGLFVIQPEEVDAFLVPLPVGRLPGVGKVTMPGFAFSMLVSKNIPANHRERCFVHGPGNPVIVTTLIDKLLVDDAVKMRQKALYNIPA
jgi:DNA polymerase-4